MLDSLPQLLSAPVLFFLLGVFACLVRSDLDIPQPIPKLLSLYLLIGIGLKGGIELRAATLSFDVVAGLAAAIVLSAAVPLWTFFLLRRRLGSADAAGVAATYGSISAVTFILAVSFLETRNEPYGGHMVASMALMESPAIIIGLLLARRFGVAQTDPLPTRRPMGTIAPDAFGSPTVPGLEHEQTPFRWRTLVHEAVFNSAVLLLLGSLAIGAILGHDGFTELSPLFGTPFKGVLCLFLLDMGLLAARRLGDLGRAGISTTGFALVAPPVHAAIGIGSAWLLGLSPGDALLLAVLVGSASYIAVPAALRLSLPEANPSIFVPMSLGLTFPFNVVIGIPLYWGVITWLWSA
ncbi:MAG: sodium-dependent bicarbonate transport family permease [Planctomycetota bacterium]